jgi:Protein of unknown function (DUF642)
VTGLKRYMMGAVAIAAAVFLGAVRPANANLLVNGNFAATSLAPGGHAGTGVPSLTWPTGWTVTGGTTGTGNNWFFGIHAGDVGAPGNVGDNAFEAFQTTIVGDISQTFATVVGQAYSFSFVYNSGDTTPSVFDVNISNSTSSTLPINGSAPLAMFGWQLNTYTFVATSTSSTLDFTMQDEFSNVEIGDVVITAITTGVPEISATGAGSLAILVLGALALVGHAKMKKSAMI